MQWDTWEGDRGTQIEAPKTKDSVENKNPYSILQQCSDWSFVGQANA